MQGPGVNDNKANDTRTAVGAGQVKYKAQQVDPTPVVYHNKPLHVRCSTTVLT